jgi:hypothetical protein
MRRFLEVSAGCSHPTWRVNETRDAITRPEHLEKTSVSRVTGTMTAKGETAVWYFEGAAARDGVPAERLRRVPLASQPDAVPHEGRVQADHRQGRDSPGRHGVGVGLGSAIAS